MDSSLHMEEFPSYANRRCWQMFLAIHPSHRLAIIHDHGNPVKSGSSVHHASPGFPYLTEFLCF